MKNGNLLSIIIPVYNVEKQLKKCVESIINQTYPSFEVILVDDGSTDLSGGLCDFYAEEYDYISVIHIKNSGITKARFMGAKASAGRWVTFVDADDWISEDAYDDVVFENSCDIVVTGICRYLSEKHQIMQLPYFEEGIYNRQDIVNEILPVMLWKPELNTWALDPSLCTKIFRREIIMEYLEKALEVESDYGEDSTVIFPMMLHARRIQISQKIYYYHRQRKQEILSPYIRDEKFFLKLYRVYEYLAKQFKMTEYWNIMKGQLDCFFINSVELKKRCYEYPRQEFSVYFPTDRISKGSRVVLYGAGKVGQQYWAQNAKYHFCNIVLWVDTDYADRKVDEQKIESPSIIEKADFDYVLIAVDGYYVAKEIVVYLNQCRVKREKIIWQSIRMDRRGFDDVFDADKEI